MDGASLCKDERPMRNRLLRLLYCISANVFRDVVHSATSNNNVIEFCDHLDKYRLNGTTKDTLMSSAY